MLFHNTTITVQSKAGLGLELDIGGRVRRRRTPRRFSKAGAPGREVHGSYLHLGEQKEAWLFIIFNVESTEASNLSSTQPSKANKPCGARRVSCSSSQEEDQPS